jgi:ribosomal-protein-serine acetyltransferase
MEIKIDNILWLALINENHSEAIFNLIEKNRPYLRQWLPWVDYSISVEDTKKYIQSSLMRYSNGNGFDLLILLNNEIVGVIGLREIDHFNKTTSIGYWLGKDFQGKGLMTKSCRALTNYCFESLNLNRVVVNCATENYMSQAIPERLHFFKEAVVRQGEFLNGRFVDFFVYSKLHHEWTEEMDTLKIPNYNS